VIDSFSIAEPKTKTMVSILEKLKANKPLIVMGSREETVEKSARNIPGALTLTSDGINVYDLLAHDHLVITKDAVSKVEEALA